MSGDEESFEEIEVDYRYEEREDRVPVCESSRPYEGLSNIQLIPTLAHPEEPRWQLRPHVIRKEDSSSNTV
ncbi:hypothetical protein AMTR_s00053p00200850 [Amborella trichopoda]|uniref:Uncharacterized protein n=1 Tax=Amborella trichopoda TaxID=13333 RepID=W1P5N1_AMBTC|nr:hypothetical protein AMTR_s00053p00200850 [Amborella trichopoda]